MDCCGVRDLLRYAVKEYRPTNGIDDLLCQERKAQAADERKVVSLRTGKPLPPWVEPPSA